MNDEAEQRARGRAGVVARIVVLILASQVLFWLALTFAEHKARPPGMEPRAGIDITFLDQQGRALDAQARLVAKYTGADGYVAPGRDGAAGVRFEVPFEARDPGKPLALYLSLRELVREIRLNGVIIQSDAPLERIKGQVTSEPAYYRLPAALVKPGRNVITIEKRDFGFVGALSEFSIGPAEPLAEAYRWKTFLEVDLPLGGIAVLIFTVLLCLVINWPAEDRPRIRALCVLLATCAASTYLLSFNPPAEIPLGLTVLLISASGLGIGASAVWYVLRDSAAPAIWNRPLAWAASLASGGLLAMFLLALLLQDYAFYWYSRMVEFSHWAVMGFCALAVVLSAAAIVTSRGERWLERFILIFCFTTFLVDRLGSVMDIHSPLSPGQPLSLHLSPIVGSLLGLAMVVSLAKHASEARRAVVSANEILAEQLAVKQAELAESFETRRKMLQRQVLLEERQRIVRDMHDGIGGQLLGLILQVRARTLKPPAIEAALQGSLDDLRLIVDSLDSAEDSLKAALEALQYRLRGQVEAAGCALVVEDDLEDSRFRPGPQVTLQVLRIVQEAVTNALRHARPRTILLRSFEDGEGFVQVVVQDDGTGFAGEPKGGRGLASMRARAAGLRGEIAIENAASGVTVRLRLPL